MVNSLLEAIFPNYCVLCGLRCFRDVPLCGSCQDTLAPNRHGCIHCALPVVESAHGGGPRICGQCLVQTPPFIGVTVPWLYDENFACLVHRWKFHRERRLSPLLARLWLARTPAVSIVDVVIPVPLHWRRLWQRGFNQSQLLCQQLLRQSPILGSVELSSNSIRRLRATCSQASLNAGDRATNLTGAFQVTRPVGGLHIAIVDDVMTTGATVTALSNTLLAAGAASVVVWCLARTPAPPI